jgi:hypothetical protein
MMLLLVKISLFAAFAARFASANTDRLCWNPARRSRTNGVHRSTVSMLWANTSSLDWLVCEIRGQCLDEDRGGFLLDFGDGCGDVSGSAIGKVYFVSAQGDRVHLHRTYRPDRRWSKQCSPAPTG